MPSPPYASEMPIRASHRYISRLLKTDFRDDRRAPDPEALDHVCEVFAQLGGSWADLFLRSAHFEVQHLVVFRKYKNRHGSQILGSTCTVRGSRPTAGTYRAASRGVGPR